MRSPYPEFVLTNIICIEKDLKGTEIVFVLTRFYCIILNLFINNLVPIYSSNSVIYKYCSAPQGTTVIGTIIFIVPI